MKLLTSLPLALLSGHALAKCGQGTFSGLNDFSDLQLGAACVLGPHNLYTCGTSGASVVHDGSRIKLQAGDIGTMVVVACEDFKSFLFHCSARDSFVFTQPECAGAVSSVNIVTEPPK
ncbi:hypothetical protein E4U57_007566 [Claviceps arundinis]|uniref:Uncharacterized protein n=1 Tax=Claviceps arundinis TaxID=1623583 RepID=A0A9P7MZZ8_9HYPO|nr:hypothetical protein E4U57_007566 [Claviceps arundinis]KAG5977584.1 hypothetical protein E4U56_007334 [Claviceps arundinis]